MKTQSKIDELIQTCHIAAKGKGFWDTERNQDEAFALILSELFEAFESHRKGKFANMVDFDKNVNLSLCEVGSDTWETFFKHFIKDTFEDEIADALIRLFDYCAGFNVELLYANLGMSEIISENFGESLLKILKMVLPANFEVLNTSILFYYLLEIVEKHSINIERHIELKLKYNSLRPYKHGKSY